MIQPFKNVAQELIVRYVNSAYELCSKILLLWYFLFLKIYLVDIKESAARSEVCERKQRRKTMKICSAIEYKNINSQHTILCILAAVLLLVTPFPFRHGISARP